MINNFFNLKVYAKQAFDGKIKFSRGFKSPEYNSRFRIVFNFIFLE